jgi:prophage DNA circulation protein
MVSRLPTRDLPNSIQDQLFPASYRNVGFFVTDTTTAGGRKDAKKEFINSDLQIVQDLGLKNRTYNVTGVVAATHDPGGTLIKSYRENRDALLAALEKGGTGTLIHPFYGKQENMVCRTFSLNETMSTIGDATITMVFEISNTNGIKASPNISIPRISRAQRAIDAAGQLAILVGFDTSGAAGGTSTDAASKLSEFGDLIDKASKSNRLSEALDIDKFNELQNNIGVWQTRVDTLVANPSDMATEMSNLFRELDGLFSAPIDTYNSLQSMFDMGGLDIPYENTQTYLSLQRQKNRDILNNNNRALGLSYSYLSAAQLDFQTVEEIEVVSSDLEDQYQLLLTSEVDKDLLDSVTEQRGDTVELFAQQKLSARQTVDIRTNLTTTRLLSFSYYGTSEDGETLAKLNELENFEVVGDIEVLSP